jgi:hypothetical protein
VFNVVVRAATSTSPSPEGAGREKTVEVTGRVDLEANRWYTLALDWNAERGMCRVFVDGHQAAAIEQLNSTPIGVSYLRLASTAAGADEAGFLVERVDVDVTQ